MAESPKAYWKLDILSEQCKDPVYRIICKWEILVRNSYYQVFSFFHCPVHLFNSFPVISHMLDHINAYCLVKYIVLERHCCCACDDIKYRGIPCFGNQKIIEIDIYPYNM